MTTEVALIFCGHLLVSWSLPLLALDSCFWKTSRLFNATKNLVPHQFSFIVHEKRNSLQKRELRFDRRISMSFFPKRRRMFSEMLHQGVSEKHFENKEIQREGHCIACRQYRRRGSFALLIQKLQVLMEKKNFKMSDAGRCRH